MEHIVQFGINIDDEAIKKAIVGNVTTLVANQIKQDVMKTIAGKKDISNYDYSNKLNEIVDRNVVDFLELNKDDIVDKAAKILSDKLLKTKQVKNVLENITDSLLN